MEVTANKTATAGIENSLARARLLWVAAEVRDREAEGSNPSPPTLFDLRPPAVSGVNATMPLYWCGRDVAHPPNSGGRRVKSLDCIHDGSRSCLDEMSVLQLKGPVVRHPAGPDLVVDSVRRLLKMHKRHRHRPTRSDRAGDWGVKPQILVPLHPLPDRHLAVVVLANRHHHHLGSFAPRKRYVAHASSVTRCAAIGRRPASASPCFAAGSRAA